MSTLMNEEILTTIEDGDVDLSAVEELIELGDKQGYVTIDDILEHLPEAEREVNKLEAVFETLLQAGIPYVDSEEDIENLQVKTPAEAESAEEEEIGAPEEGALTNISTNDLLGIYLNEATDTPLLSKEEEIDLSKRIERGREAREKLAQADPDSEKRKELLEQIEDGRAAREHLISANSRLVISIAKKHVGRGLPFLDLIQEGNIGLMRAAKKFDYRMGNRFSTYATWWIRQAVKRAIANKGRTIRIPAHMGDKISKLARTQHQLLQDLGREATVEEIAENMGVSPQRVKSIMKNARRPLSLERPTGADNESELSDFVEDQDTPPPEEVAGENLMRQNLDEVLKELPPREERVVRLRYGLADGEKHTLQEVGKKMGITRERVRQIELQALRRLRRVPMRRKLREFINQS